MTQPELTSNVRGTRGASAWSTHATAFTLVLPVACIDTEVAAIDAPPACTPSAPALTTDGAIVETRAAFDAGVVRCSGVVIAPTLVLTALGCVVRPPGVGDSTLQMNSGGAQDRFDGAVSYDDACSHGESWSPIEDGSFTGRLGQLYSPRELSVRLPPSTDRVGVSRIVTSGASSRCADGLAILAMDRDMGALPVQLRLDRPSEFDQLVISKGYCSVEGLPQLRELQSTIRGITLDTGSADAPPRTLIFDHELTALEYGGALVSSDTQSLIGIIASGSGSRCDSTNPEGQSMAIRVAAFRRMLLSAADETGETLEVEAAEQQLGAVAVPRCSP